MMSEGRESRLAVCLVLAIALHAAMLWLGGWRQRPAERTDRTLAVRLGFSEASRQVPPTRRQPTAAGQRDGREKDLRPAENAQVVHSRAAPVPRASPGTAEPPSRSLEQQVETLHPGISEGMRLAREDYRQVLAGWLSQHREYPLHLRRLGVTGEGVLHLEVERTGALVLARMEEGTGDRRLDELTLALAKRADPFPAMPEDLAGSTFDCLIDVRYELTP
jgi:TonB family protein